MRIPRAFPALAVAGLTAACGPTIISRDSLAYSADSRAGVEVRMVQPDAMDPDYQTRELWGFNTGAQAVCAGYRSGGSSWSAWTLAPGTERRLIGLGSGYIEGARGVIVTLPNGEACTDGYVAQMIERHGG